MPLIVSRARVKERCGIADAAYDAAIDNLILDVVPVLERTIRADRLADPALAATLNLAALEVVCGEFGLLTSREPGATDEIRLGDLVIKPDAALRAREARALIATGLERLRPFQKDEATLASAATPLVGGAGENPFAGGGQ